MTKENLKEYITYFGGLLSAVLLFLQTQGLSFDWFTSESINAFLNVLTAAIPLVLLGFAVHKNTYIMTKKARKQKEVLKESGLK